MTVAPHLSTALIRRQLLPELSAAVQATADAHEALRARTDTVLACHYLPAEVYGYAPRLSETGAAVTGATRFLTGVTGRATADPTPENVDALHRATIHLTDAVADLRAQTAALATAAAWYTGALPGTPVATGR